MVVVNKVKRIFINLLIIASLSVTNGRPMKNDIITKPIRTFIAPYKSQIEAKQLRREDIDINVLHLGKYSVPSDSTLAYLIMLTDQNIENKRRRFSYMKGITLMCKLKNPKLNTKGCKKLIYLAEKDYQYRMVTTSKTKTFFDMDSM